MFFALMLLYIVVYRNGRWEYHACQVSFRSGVIQVYNSFISLAYILLFALIYKIVSM